ncbi:hypothetical protein N7535_005350 [Penicillium sp. DV-2018c]|nr:hypothetical protein N7461_008931 [Penicillium sp. DV-2018c]KAJ5571690.1 hypothetical protein N7535_005350 [Penicillium sp. DV-2018c]
MSKPLPLLCTQGDAMSTTTDSEALDTPTGTSVSGEPMEASTIHEEYRKSRSWNCPWPNRTFIIRDPATKLVLGLEKGSLRLVSELCLHDRSVHWRCVETWGGQWGLQNDITGAFMGVHPDDIGGAAAYSSRLSMEGTTPAGQSTWIREHPDGGYTICLHTNQKRVFQLRAEADHVIRADTRSGRPYQGIAWEFVRVDL